MSSPPTSETRRNPWTHVLVACCTVFIVTVFLMVAAAFNKQAASLSRFFDLHGMLILGVEVGAILLTAFIVLVVERRETRRQIEERERALLEDHPKREPAGTGGLSASGNAHSAPWAERTLADPEGAPPTVPPGTSGEELSRPPGEELP